MTYVCLETRNSVDLQANSVAGTCNEPKEQELHGASEVSDEQDKPPPNKWKQRIKTTQAIIGPGFVVAIAYLDPGSFQADIDVGSAAKYRLVWTVLWSTLLSLYIQMLCVRLVVYKGTCLAQSMGDSLPDRACKISWVIAEITVVLTDLPAVIGMSIAFKILFGLPYYIGVILSFVSTFFFLSSQAVSERAIEFISMFFVFTLSIALFIAWGMVGTDFVALVKGATTDIIHTELDDTFEIIGMLGAVVMPHNLYLHTGCIKNRQHMFDSTTADSFVKKSSYEMFGPIIYSFFVNTAIIVIATHFTFGEHVGLTNFGSFLDEATCTNQVMKYLWGLALFSGSQSSCATATATGEIVMSGLLNWKLHYLVQGIGIRCCTMLPCVVVAILCEESDLDLTVSSVNSVVALLLPFAFMPLVKFVSSADYMGPGAVSCVHSMFMRGTAIAVLVINSVVLLIPGGGFFGDLLRDSTTTGEMVIYMVVGIFTVLVYIAWNLYIFLLPIRSYASHKPNNSLEIEKKTTH